MSKKAATMNQSTPIEKVPYGCIWEELPPGWIWEWRESQKRWGARSSYCQFWCDEHECWDSGSMPIPTAVVITVLRANGLIP